MKRSRSFGYLVAAAALVLAANGLILAEAAWNRRGAAIARMELTERELSIPADRLADSTALFLTVKLVQDPPERVREVAIRKRYPLSRTTFSWLDRKKLTDLGFRFDDRFDATDEDHRPARPAVGTRRAFLVLEFDGEAWSKWIAAEAERVSEVRAQVRTGTASSADLADAEALLAIDRAMRSRLVPIDAGYDRAALRARYPDGDRYAIAEGIVAAAAVRDAGGDVEVRGEILSLVVDQVYVPNELRARLDELPVDPRPAGAAPPWPTPREARYRVDLAFGRRGDPWLAGVR